MRRCQLFQFFYFFIFFYFNTFLCVPVPTGQTVCWRIKSLLAIYRFMTAWRDDRSLALLFLFFSLLSPRSIYISPIFLCFVYICPLRLLLVFMIFRDPWEKFFGPEKIMWVCNFLVHCVTWRGVSRRGGWGRGVQPTPFTSRDSWKAGVWKFSKYFFQWKSRGMVVQGHVTLTVESQPMDRQKKSIKRESEQ